MKFFPLKSAVILEVSGRDAPRYLNARLTNEIKSIAAGETCYAGALTPQGRTQALFRVCVVEPGRFFLVCDGGERCKVISAFRQYLVADRVDVADRSDDYALIHAAGPECATTLASLSANSHIPEGVGTIGWKDQTGIYPSVRARTPGFDILIQRTGAPDLLSGLLKAGGVELDSDKIRAMRICAGIPAFPEEINEESLFAEAGLDLAISPIKGCYVGQEVIEKIRSRGKPPRRLTAMFVSGSVSLNAGDSVRISGDKEPEVGRVVSSAYCDDEDRTYFFASMKSELADSAAFQVNGCSALQAPR